MPNKGVDQTIKALPELVKKFPDLQYRIAGDGPDRNRLEKLAEMMQVKNHVTFLGKINLEQLRKEAERELQFASVGRKERVSAKADALRPRPEWLEAKGAALRSETYETAKLRFPGYDIYFVEAEWRAWAAGKPPARDADRAYLAFFKTYAENNPI